ncbi:unnamed protein product [Mytilus coruscus]|uniref:Uncharacterized protein n=1 Tax=Mytilus coruscus TaxID=42192 RepID=A0A6J8BCU8_MYTCO|nr:unnamed protein product [Mytilus coruscus]
MKITNDIDVTTSKVCVRVKASKRDISNIHDESTVAASLTGFTKEEINFTKMGMIVLNILADALYDLLKQDKQNLRPRCDCDITYLYSEHRNLNKHIPSNSWGGQWQRIQNTDLAIGDDIERIRLTRNELQHSRIFQLDNKRFIQLCNILSDLLKRFDQHNKPTRLYTDHLNDILAKTISAEEVKSIENEILGTDLQKTNPLCIESIILSREFMLLVEVELRNFNGQDSGPKTILIRANSDSNNTLANSVSNTPTNSDSNTQANSDSNTQAHSDYNTQANSYSITLAIADSHSYTQANSESNTQANSDFYTKAKLSMFYIM